jgi:hypothetical protein
MVYANICLNCGSIEYYYYGEATKTFISTLYGEDFVDDTFDIQGTCCADCHSEYLNEFNLDLLSHQEKTLFFHFKGERRLLYFLRLAKDIPELIENYYQNNEDLEIKLKLLEEKLGE